MRILVISDLPHFVTGGAERQAARLIEAWLDQGHEVICLGRRMGGGPVAIGRHRLVVKRIRTTSLFGRWGRAVSYALSLTLLLLAHRAWADVIYTRFLGEAAATASLLRRFGWIAAPIVATPANTGGRGDIDFLLALPFAGRIVGLLEAECGAINLIATDMIGELKEAGFSGDNFTSIPNGIPLTPLHDGRSAENKLVAVGRLAPQKGYDVLLPALAAVRARLAPAQVTIVGDGPERERLRKQSRALGLDDHVVWAGELEQVHVERALERASIFLLPSRYEGMSNAGLEAMERGLPVMLTRCGGLDRYVTPQMGWVVPPGDVDALAQALSNALAVTPEALVTMGLHCREVVVNEFDIVSTAARYVRLFEALRNGKKVGDQVAT